MVDIRRLGKDGVIRRLREVRRGEFSPEVTIADASIPGSGLFFSTDNEMMIAPRTAVLGIDTEGASLPAAWTQSHVGTGSATHSQGELFLAPGATPNSRSRVTSVRTGRRRAGATQWYIAVWRVDNLGAVNNVRRFGMYDDNEGFFFEVRSDGLWVGYRKGGVATYVAPADQNGPLLGSTLDLTKMNQFNLFYGGLSCRWQVNGRVLHGIGAGVPSEALTASVNLPIRAETINSAGQTVNARLIGRGVSFHRVSPNGIIPVYRRISGAATTVVEQGPTTLRRIVVSNTVGGTITVYDNTAASGAVVALLSTVASGGPASIEFGVETSVGLTVVTSNAGHDITVVYE